MLKKGLVGIFLVVLVSVNPLLCIGQSMPNIQETMDMINLLLNLDDMFITTAAEANGIPIMYEKDKWVQVSFDVLPLAPVKYGNATYPVPMWANINVRVDALKESDFIPELTLSGGYWTFLPALIATSFSGGMVDINFSNWNVGGCISKSTGEKVRQHIALQYSRLTGGIGGEMVTQMASAAETMGLDVSSLTSIVTVNRLDLLFGIDYEFIPRRTGFFLVGYDLMQGEIFERIGIKFGNWIYKVGIYPGSVVSIAPSIECSLAF